MRNFLLPLLVFLSVSVNGQIIKSGLSDENLHVISILLTIFLFGAFIVSMTKILLDYKLKNKMLENGFSEKGMEQILNTNKISPKNQAIKWGCTALTD